MDIATLHDCLVPKPEEGEEARITFRLKPSVKRKLERICERHGITVNGFLRNCAERLTQEVGDAEA